MEDHFGGHHFGRVDRSVFPPVPDFKSNRRRTDFKGLPIVQPVISIRGFGIDIKNSHLLQFFTAVARILDGGLIDIDQTAPEIMQEEHFRRLLHQGAKFALAFTHGLLGSFLTGDVFPCAQCAGYGTRFTAQEGVVPGNEAGFTASGDNRIDKKFGGFDFTLNQFQKMWEYPFHSFGLGEMLRKPVLTDELGFLIAQKSAALGIDQADSAFCVQSDNDGFCRIQISSGQIPFSDYLFLGPFLLSQLNMGPQHADGLALFVPDGHAAAADPDRGAVLVAVANHLVVRMLRVCAMLVEIVQSRLQVFWINEILPF